MKKELVCLSLLAGAAAYALDFRQGGLSGSQAEAIHGTLLASSDQGARWREVIPGAVDQGTWLKTQAGSEAVVSLSNEAHLRMAENTSIRIRHSAPDRAQVEVLQGRILASVPAHGRSQLEIETGQGGVGSSGGSTVVEVNPTSTKVESLDGSATFRSERMVSPDGQVFRGEMKGRVSPGLPVCLGTQPAEAAPLAYDGPDVRKRPHRTPYTQGEENRGRNLGEDVTPSPSPTPAATPPQTVIQPTPPPPQPSRPVVVEEGGGEVWPYLLGAAGIGTGLYFLLRDTEEDSTFVNPGVFVPASP